jgi:Methyltransferase domain
MVWTEGEAVQILQDRVAAVGRVLADPPQVHPRANGVWSTDPACYEYMATLVKPEFHTLETGLGVSTVLFALWGCHHTCVVYSEAEVIACRQHFESRGISAESVTFHIGPSERVLPNLTLRDLDLVFVDGCHGFPLATIDWFYAGSMLRAGGVAVLDDAQLLQVRLGLFDFLKRDPRWTRTGRRPKWVAYERLESGALGEEWEQQPFLGVPMRNRYENLVPAAARPFVKAAGRRLRLL